jgi:large subunit ribosomal protein L31
MRDGIHPKYYPEAKVICSCGNTWTTGSTQEVIRTDVCSQCHPFFTGEQRIIDSAGQVDRFMKRLNQFSSHQEDMSRRAQEARRKAEQRFLNQQLAALDLNSQLFQNLLDANVVTVGDLTKRLGQGDENLMKIEGVGPKSVEEVKAKLEAAREAYFAKI